MQTLNIFLTYLPGIDEFSKPYDSSLGIPSWVFIPIVIFVLYIIVRVYISIRKEKRSQNKLLNESKKSISIDQTHIETDSNSRIIEVRIIESKTGELLIRIKSDFFDLKEKWITITELSLISMFSNNALWDLAITKFIEICETAGFNIINGQINYDDWWYIKKLGRFYRKHDFRVTLDYKNKEGNVEKVLKDKNNKEMALNHPLPAKSTN